MCRLGYVIQCGFIGVLVPFLLICVILDKLVFVCSLTPSYSSSQSNVAGNLAVSIDQPLVFDNLSPLTTQPLRPIFRLPDNINIDWSMIKKACMGFLTSDKFRGAAAAFTVFLLFSLIINSRKTSSNDPNNLPDESSRGGLFGSTTRSIITTLKQIISKFFSVFGRVFKKQVDEVGTPMPFDYSNDNEGWGVCTLRSKRRLGRSSFVQYEFDLPESDYVLPLDLGQQISVCCLDNHSNVAKGEFFCYNPDSRTRLGTFSILAPNRTPTENEFAIGDDAANFVSQSEAKNLLMAVSGDLCFTC